MSKKRLPKKLNKQEIQDFLIQFQSLTIVEQIDIIKEFENVFYWIKILSFLLLAHLLIPFLEEILK